uniref:Uncharacterized protein n=1 Tax=Siphoviridae sp. cteNz1 TaxID=2826404 RepID=A0A8S5N5S1_9CAUD|nr:MAG TPA: hypothetical protein [Siphoviridae sp. cteNz1]
MQLCLCPGIPYFRAYLGSFTTENPAANLRLKNDNT